MSTVLLVSGLQRVKGYKSCKRGLELQSILFPRKRYSAGKARSWLKKKGRKYGKKRLDTTKNYHRFRQLEPNQCVRGSLRTITLGKGIKAVTCCPKR